MKKPEFKKELPKMNFAKVGVSILVLLCLAVLVYDMRSPSGDDLLPEADIVSGSYDVQITPEPEQQPQTGEQQSADSFYSEYRLQREQVRAEELELLQSIIDDPNSSTEMRNVANERKLAIAENMEYELMTENVLFAKDFGETVVMMGRDTVTVVVSGALDDIAAAQVADAVMGVTGVDYQSVVIINR